MRQLSQTDIGHLRGISQSLVSRYKREGMPVDDIAAARRWLKDYVAPRMKTPLDGWMKRRS